MINVFITHFIKSFQFILYVFEKIYIVYITLLNFFYIDYQQCNNLITFLFIVVRAFFTFFDDVSHISLYKKHFINSSLIIMIINFQNK